MAKIEIKDGKPVIRQTVAVKMPTAEELANIVRSRREDIRELLDKRLTHDGLLSLVHSELNDILRSVVEYSINNIVDGVVEEIVAKADVRAAVKSMVGDQIKETAEREARSIKLDVSHELRSVMHERAEELVKEYMPSDEDFEHMHSTVVTKTEEYLAKDISEIVRHELGLLYEEMRETKRHLQELFDKVHSLEYPRT